MLILKRRLGSESGLHLENCCRGGGSDMIVGFDTGRKKKGKDRELNYI